MNNAATEQPLPKPGEDSVHELFTLRFGTGVAKLVSQDILKRAEKAKDKYKLDKVGLYTFNGRDSLLDAYQEILDLIIYMFQFELEEEARVVKGEAEDTRISSAYIMRLISDAIHIREHLVEQGDFE